VRPAGTLDPIAALWRQRKLLRRFAVNDALGKYRGSLLGLCWSFLNPLLMLAVFTIAFGTVFRGAAFTNGLVERPVVLPIFCGMVVFGVFGEVLGRTPMCIVGQPNYVKKIVFPLEVLPTAILGSSLLHALIGLSILIVGQLALGFGLPWTAVLLPVVLLPLLLFALGTGFLLSSLGVYVRDIGHSIGVVSQALFFLTPVVYPFKAIEDGAPAMAAVLRWNPLKVVVDGARECLIYGVVPAPLPLLAVSVVGVAVTWLGFLWFQKTRAGFADVV